MSSWNLLLWKWLRFSGKEILNHEMSSTDPSYIWSHNFACKLKKHLNILEKSFFDNSFVCHRIWTQKHCKFCICEFVAMKLSEIIVTSYFIVMVVNLKLVSSSVELNVTFNWHIHVRCSPVSISNITNFFHQLRCKILRRHVLICGRDIINLHVYNQWKKNIMMLCIKVHNSYLDNLISVFLFHWKVFTNY